MPTYNVNVRWGKTTVKDVKLNTEEEPAKFKDELSNLTGVKPSRQKIMLSGQTLKDDTWDQMRLRDGMTLLMMGSKEEDLAAVEMGPAAVTAGGAFLGIRNIGISSSSRAASSRQITPGTSAHQVASKEALASFGVGSSDHHGGIWPPRGLKNLGNSCYFNATLQCLFTVPELREAVLIYDADHPPISPAGRRDPLNARVATTMRLVFHEMDIREGNKLNVGPEDPYNPALMLLALHKRVPSFGTTDSTGRFQQHDANECWTELMRILQDEIRSPDGQGDLVTKMFRGTLESKFTCLESAEEPSTTSTEGFLQLSCFISPEIKYLQSGLRARFKPENLEKRSQVLGRNAHFSRQQFITRLPAYLTIQFVRFHFKEKQNMNAKILRDVSFPLRIDVYEFCSMDLKSRLDPAREKLVDAVPRARAAADASGGGSSASPTAGRVMRRGFLPDDFGSSDTGVYDLQAVLTHKGRSSQSGHYVAWVSPRARPEMVGRYSKTDWFKMDDTHVSVVDDTEILKLSGGGDWHCAYVLLYGPPVQ